MLMSFEMYFSTDGGGTYSFSTSFSTSLKYLATLPFSIPAALATSLSVLETPHFLQARYTVAAVIPRIDLLFATFIFADVR